MTQADPISTEVPALRSVRQRITSAFNRNLSAAVQSEPTILRYVLLRAARQGRPVTRILSIVSVTISLLGLLAFGYWLAAQTGHVTFLDLFNPLEKAYDVLFWPLVILQVGTRLAALSGTIGVTAAEVRRGTWETLRSTVHGAGSTLRMHWLSVFYRLRPLLIALIVLRTWFIFSSLITFTAVNGNYLDNMIGVVLPPGSTPLFAILRTAAGILLIAAGMTASLILPFSALAVDAAVGTLIGTFTRRGRLGSLIQTGLSMVRLAVSGLALLIGALAIFGFDQTLNIFGLHSQISLTSGVLRWIGALIGLTEGDGGLTLLHQSHVQFIWGDIPLGALISAAALIYAIVQMVIARSLLRWAIRRAERPDPR